MCRWLAYSGSPVLLEDLLFKPENSLVVQSMHSRLGVETMNGDGFGVGWYGAEETPGIYHSTEPAWNDRNLRELSAHASAGRVFAHIRASTGTAVQQTNCHPFRHGRWLWMHNGVIADFPKLKRDLTLAVDPAVPGDRGIDRLRALLLPRPDLRARQDPPAAVARAVGLIEETGRRHGVEHPIQMTVATTDGETTWAFRYSSEGRSRSLFHSADVSTLRLQYPDNPVLHDLSDDARLVVSEPLGDLRERGARCRSPPASSSAVAGRRCTSSHPRLCLRFGGIADIVGKASQSNVPGSVP